MSLFRVDPERIKTLQGRIADIRTSLETHPVPSRRRGFFLPGYSLRAG